MYVCDVLGLKCRPIEGCPKEICGGAVIPHVISGLKSIFLYEDEYVRVLWECYGNR